MTRFVREVKLIVGGEELTGWDQWEVESDLLYPANVFSISAQNKAGRLASKPRPGDAFKLMLDGKKTMVGYVDDVVHDTDENEARVSVNGRDNFGPLVDCSATPKTHRNVTLLTLAQTLTAPWSLTWATNSAAPTLKTHKSVKVDPGESIMDVLQRVAEKERVLLWCAADGTCYIGRPSYSLAPVHRLRLHLPASGQTGDNNVMTSRVTRSWRDRFATITVAGTGANDANACARTSHRRYVITDSGVASARPMIMINGDIRTLDQAKTLATLEYQKRLRDSVELEYSVPGHYGTPATESQSPALFDVDQRVDLVDEPAGISSAKVLLIRRRFVMDESGPRTDLSLAAEVWMT